MESNTRNPIFTKRNIIIGGAVLILLIISIFFLVACNRKVKVEKIEVSQSNLSIAPGQTFALKSNVYPSNASNKSLTYTSLDPTIATVDDKGMVTALKAGKTQIVIKSPDTDLVTACDVIIASSPDVATEIVFGTSETTINKGDKQLIKTTIIPDTAKIPTLMYASSDANIASVDKDGYVIGNGVGTATITVTGNNGTTNLTATTKVIVVEKGANSNPNTGTPNVDNPSVGTPTGENPGIQVASISLNKTDIDLEKNKEYQLVANIQSTNGTPTVSWKSSDESVVTVDSTGKVTAIKEGTAKITASAGGKETTANITVKKASTDGQSPNDGSNNNGNNDGSNDGGNSGNGTQNIKDTTNPEIKITVLTPEGDEDWYPSAIELKVEATDASGIASINYCMTNTRCESNRTLASGSTVKITNDGYALAIFAKDRKGNKAYVITPYYKLDKDIPYCTINGTTANSTISFNNVSGADVKVKCIDKVGIKKVILPDGSESNQSEFTYTISKSGNNAFTVIDKGGNKRTMNLTVRGIIADKTIPTCKISANVTAKFKKDVTLTVSSNDKDLSVNAYSWTSKNNFSSQNTKVVSINATYTAYVRDKAGNIGKCQYTVINTDSDNPYCTISQLKSGDSVLLSASGSDKTSVAESVRFINPVTDSKRYKNTVTVTQNGIYEAEVTDSVGNKGKCSTTVNSLTTQRDTTQPKISISNSGTLGKNGWYTSNVDVRATVTDNSPVTVKYCSVNTTSTGRTSCDPNLTYSSSGIKVTFGQWVVVILAKDSAGNTSKTTLNYKIDNVKPVCNFSIFDYWESSKKVTLIGADATSGFYRLKINSNSYVYDKTTSISNQTEGTYNGTCEDNAGNVSTATARIESKKEYAYRTCKTCTATTSTFSGWVKKSQGCYSTNKSPVKSYAERYGTTEYYECTYQTGDGNGCKGKYYCRYYTRTKYTNRSCLKGCETWNAWSDYSTIVQNALQTQYQYKEIKTRITYNVG